MAKLTLTDLANLSNPSTAVAAINANNTLIEAAIENTVSRDGTTPNTLTADLNVNNKTLSNVKLSLPTSDPQVLNALWNSSGTVKISAG